MRRPLRTASWDLSTAAAVALAIATAVAFAVVSIERHRRFGSNAFDLGLYDQSVWAFSRLDPLADNTVLGTPSMFGNHFQPILLVLAPLYWLWEDVRMLLIAQAVLLASASVPLFLWARRELGVAAALLFQAAFLAYWALLAGNLYDFHETAVAAPAIAVGLYGLVTRRFGLLVAGSVLALLTKEDLALTVSAMFAYAAAVGLRRRESVVAAIACIVWLAFAIEVLIPWYSGGSYEHWLYPALGAGPGAAFVHVVTHPLDTIRLFFSPEEKRIALVNLIAPWLGLALLSPLVLLALPNLAARFLSDKESYWSQGFHYSLMIAPVLAFAAVDGTRRLRTLVPFRRLPEVAACAVLIVGLYFTFGRLRPLDEIDRLPSEPIAAEMDDCLAPIPEAASVAATSALVPHLAHRPNVRLIERPNVPDAEVIAIDAYTWLHPLRQEDLATLVAAARARGYGVMCSVGGTAVLTRGARGELSPALRRLLKTS